MKRLLMLPFLFVSFAAFTQPEEGDQPDLIFTPLKVAGGGRFGSFDRWNEQLDKHGFTNINMNNELTFECTLYFKNHLVIKSLVGINQDKDSTFLNNKRMQYKRRMYGMNIGYNLFSINKIGQWILVPSVGIYTGRDKLNCTSRTQNALSHYDVSYTTLYRYESGINPNLYVSLNPFSKNSVFSFFGLGFDIGAFYNMNLTHHTQYKNSLDGAQLKNDKQLSPYLKISIEPLRGVFYYEKKKQHGNMTSSFF